SSRAGLPSSVSHADAAYSSGRAALLGASLATGDLELLTAALDDRLHEPYRSDAAPLVAELKAKPAPGSVGVTLSGSGPTVIVWARHEAVEACAQELRTRFAACEVLAAALATSGTHSW
ncbi:MAG: homoserine kinase, partial [Gaiellaceae bacterium]